MAKLTLPTRYRFGDDVVEVLPYFLYEVSQYLTTSNKFYCIKSEFIKRDNALTIKNSVSVKQFKGYTIDTHINCIAVTEEFVKSNKLKVYERKNKLHNR